MNISQTFSVRRPISEVWDILGDVPFVASCLPGATLSADLGNDRYAGHFLVKVGPIRARFSGEVVLQRDAGNFSGQLSGKGSDSKTASSARAEATYRLTTLENDRATRVDITAEVALTGVLAQFGKSAVVNEIASRLTREFAANLNAGLCAENGHEPASSRKDSPLNLGRLVVTAVGFELQKFFTRFRKFMTG